MFKKVLKLSLANLLGLLTAMAGAFGFFLIFGLFFGAIMISSLPFLGTDPQAPMDNPLQLGLGFLILMLVGYLIYMLFITLVQSFLVSGNFGSSVSALYDGVASVGDFFRNAGRHLWKMMLFFILISLPYMILDLVLQIVIPFTFDPSILMSDDFTVTMLLITLVLSLPYMYLYCVGPLLIIRERMGVWDSIKSSFRIITKNFGNTTVTVLSVIGIGLVFSGVIFFWALISGISLFSTDYFPEPEQILLFFGLTIPTVILLMPILMAVTHLIIVSRYKKHIEPVWFPKEPGSVPDDGSEPVFDIKKPE